MIEIKDLGKKYDKYCALKNINFLLDDKGMVFLLGRSGSGKSTLLNVIGGLDSASCGTVNVDGNLISALNHKELCDFRNTHIGFVFQDYHLIDNLTVYENVKLALDLKNELDEDAILRALENVGLSGCENRYPSQLSGGEQQRVAIARALIKKPRIIIADEPTGNLDSVTSKVIMEILKELSKDYLVIIASHNTEDAKVYGDRVIEILDGEIISDETSNCDVNEETCEEIHEVGAPKVHIESKKMRSNMVFGLGFKFLKKNFLSIIISSCILAMLLIVLAISQTIVKFDAGAVLKEGIKGSGSDALFISKKYIGKEESADKYAINCYKEIKEKDIRTFEETSYDGNIYEVLNYDIPIKNSSNFAGFSTTVISDSPYAVEPLGTMIVDEQYFKNRFGELEFCALAEDIHPTGIYITDYLADSILYYARYKNIDYMNKSYEDMLGEYHWGESYSNTMISRGYINGIIKTGYREKYMILFDKFDNNLYENLDDVENETLLMELAEDIYSKLGFCYSLNKSFKEDAITNPAWDYCWHYELAMENEDNIIFDIPQVRKDELYGLQLNEDEVWMEYSKYNEVFGTNYTKENYKDFEPHTVELSNKKYFEKTIKSSLHDKNIVIAGLFSKNDMPGSDGTFIASSNLYEEFNEDFIYPIGLYFEVDENVGELINIANDLGFEQNTLAQDGIVLMTEVVQVFIPIFRFFEVFLCIGVILLLIKTSFKIIKDKKKEIGILKALGMKNGYVSMAFGMQVILIAIITFIIYLVGYYYFVDMANEILVDSLKNISNNRVVFDMKFIRFNKGIAVMNGVMIVVFSFISFALSVMKLRGIEPVSIIKGN